MDATQPGYIQNGLEKDQAIGNYDQQVRLKYRQRLLVALLT